MYNFTNCSCFIMFYKWVDPTLELMYKVREGFIYIYITNCSCVIMFYKWFDPTLELMIRLEKDLYIYSTSGSPTLQLMYKVWEGYTYSTSGSPTLELMYKVGEGHIYSTNGSPTLLLLYTVWEGYTYSTSGSPTLELMYKVGEGYIYSTNGSPTLVLLGPFILYSSSLVLYFTLLTHQTTPLRGYFGAHIFPYRFFNVDAILLTPKIQPFLFFFKNFVIFPFLEKCIFCYFVN